LFLVFHAYRYLRRWVRFDAYTVSVTGTIKAIEHFEEIHSLCAAIGIETVVQRGIPSLEYDRLKWVEQVPYIKWHKEKVFNKICKV